MPDGDRFQWKLKGKGWRKLYQLLNAGASTEVLSDVAATSIANYLREADDVPFTDFIHSVQDRVTRPPLFPSPTVHAFGDSAQLCRELEDKVGLCSFTEPALLAQRAALKTFEELKGETSPPDLLKTASIFAGKLGREIVERKCLALVREAVARQANRNFEEQIAFEQGVMSSIEQVSRKLGTAISSDAGTDHIRAPRRSVTASTDTLLATPLPIAPEAR